MRRFLILLGVLGLLGVSFWMVADRRPESVRTVFQIEGMHCESCSSAINSSLEKIEGVLEVSADHAIGSAEARYQPREVDAETLKAEIEDLGYTVVSMTTETGD